MQSSRVEVKFVNKMNPELDKIAHTATTSFSDLCDSYIVVGYSRGSHQKFLFKINEKENEDQSNFSEIDEQLLTWFASGQ
jgi:hypothetical protein